MLQHARAGRTRTIAAAIIARDESVRSDREWSLPGERHPARDVRSRARIRRRAVRCVHRERGAAVGKTVGRIRIAEESRPHGRFLHESVAAAIADPRARVIGSTEATGAAGAIAVSSERGLVVVGAYHLDDRVVAVIRARLPRRRDRVGIALRENVAGIARQAIVKRGVDDDRNLAGLRTLGKRTAACVLYGAPAAGAGARKTHARTGRSGESPRTIAAAIASDDDLLA